MSCCNTYTNPETVVRGTTWSPGFTFSQVDVSTITGGKLTVVQSGTTVVEIDFSSAYVDTENQKVTFTLTQPQSLALSAGRASVQFTWIVGALRGASEWADIVVAETGVPEVLS